MRHSQFVSLIHSPRFQRLLWQQFCSVCLTVAIIWGTAASPPAIATPLDAHSSQSEGDANAPVAVDLRNGKRLFRQNCSVCHINGQNLIIGQKNLAYEALKRYRMDSLEAIAHQVTHGKNVMPAFGEALSGTQIYDIAAYVLHQAQQGW